MLSFIVVVSMLVGGMIQWFLARGITKKEDIKPKTFLGFPTAIVAHSVVSKLDQKGFNVACPYCRAKKPSWDVSGCGTLPVGEETQHVLILTCTTCASVRLVNPETLGALTFNEAQSVWTWN